MTANIAHAWVLERDANGDPIVTGGPDDGEHGIPPDPGYVEVVPLAAYRGAVEENRQLRGKLAAIRCEIDARRDCADMQAVRYYADEATTVSLGRGQS